MSSKEAPELYATQQLFRPNPDKTKRVFSGELATKRNGNGAIDTTECTQA